MAPPIEPNTLTAMRLPLAPLAVGFLLTGTTWGIVVAAVLALTIELTDLADGWIARNYDSVSDFGKLFDPYADALTRFTLFLGLYAIGEAELWMILAIFYRDSSIAFLRSIAATRQIVISARQSGKIKAVFQGFGTQICFLALVVRETVPSMASTVAEVAWWTMAVITAVTVASFFDYFHANRAILEEAWNARS
jgi:CDP-diacylglycerol--glycerol-3-phosphate 3-phosphatidyltransferase